VWLCSALCCWRPQFWDKETIRQFFVVMKYQRQPNFIRKEVHVIHSVGGSKAWHWHRLSSDEGPLVYINHDRRQR
jgi:hypothetical protein